MNVGELRAILFGVPKDWDVMVHVGDFNDNVDIFSVDATYEDPDNGYIQINVVCPDE